MRYAARHSGLAPLRKTWQRRNNKQNARKRREQPKLSQTISPAVVCVEAIKPSRVRSPMSKRRKALAVAIIRGERFVL
jgi:hypothetical protein